MHGVSAWRLVGADADNQVNSASAGLEQSSTSSSSTLLFQAALVSMSGFETASAALAVLQFTKHTVTALVQLLHDFNEAGPRLVEIAGEFDCFEWRLQVWRDTWFVDGNSQQAENELVRAVWGESGGGSIMSQLASIDHDCKRFALLMAKLLGKRHLKQFNLQRQLFETRILELSENRNESPDLFKCFTRASRASLYSDALKTAKRATHTKTRADFVLSKGEAFKSLLHGLDNKFRKLDDDSFKMFFYHHPDVPRSASHREIANEVRAGATLQRALCTRNASRALYHWCLKGEAKESLDQSRSSSSQDGNGNSNYDLKLDIGLLANRTVESPGLQFHFSVSWQQNGLEQELLVEGPLPASANTGVPSLANATQVMSLSPTDFETACSTILVRDSERFVVDQPGNLADSVILFQSKYPVPSSVSFSKASRVRLSDLLEGIHGKSSAEAFEEFPSVERFDLAFKAVEFGLQLLGTSWLSNIRSTQLLRFKNYARQQHWFVLEIENTGSDQERPLDHIEPHTFMIGILLTEIAIAEPVVGIHRYELQGRREFALKVIRTNDQGNKEQQAMKISAAIRRVKNCMGIAYGEAVEFCLRQSSISRNPAWAQLRDNCDSGSREEAYKSLLKEFHQDVFLRIQSLHELSRTRRGAVQS